jgi:hypothetical protein
MPPVYQPVSTASIADAGARSEHADQDDDQGGQGVLRAVDADAA